MNDNKKVKEPINKWNEFISNCKKFGRIPTLFWFFDTTDKNINRMMFIGSLCSFLMIIGIGPIPILLSTTYVIFFIFFFNFFYYFLLLFFSNLM